MKHVDSLSKSSIHVNSPYIRWLTLFFSTYIFIEFTPGCNYNIVHVLSSSDIDTVVDSPCVIGQLHVKLI